MSTAEHAHHIIPLETYLKIGSALIILTAVTVWVATIDLGPLNLVVAMIIAGTKASLVALYFMHLKYDNKFYMLIFLVGVLFLVILIVFTMFDTMTRGDVDPNTRGPINKDAIIYQQPATTGDAHGTEGEATENEAASGEATEGGEETPAEPSTEGAH